jgi:hypothetical protein
MIGVWPTETATWQRVSTATRPKTITTVAWAGPGPQSATGAPRRSGSARAGRRTWADTAARGGTAARGADCKASRVAVRSEDPPHWALIAENRQDLATNRRQLSVYCFSSRNQYLFRGDMAYGTGRAN